MSCVGALCCTSAPACCHAAGINASLWIVGFPVLYYDPTSSPYQYPITRRFLRKTCTISAVNHFPDEGGAFFGLTDINYSGTITIDRLSGAVTIEESGNILGNSQYSEFIGIFDFQGFESFSPSLLTISTGQTSTPITAGMYGGALVGLTISGTVSVDMEYTTSQMNTDLTGLLDYSWTTIAGWDNTACAACDSEFHFCADQFCAASVYWDNYAFWQNPDYNDQVTANDPRGFFLPAYPWSATKSDNSGLQNPFATVAEGSGYTGGVKVSTNGSAVPAYDPNAYTFLQGFAADFAWDSYIGNPYYLAVPSNVIAAAIVVLSGLEILKTGSWCQENDVSTYVSDTASIYTGNDWTCEDAGETSGSSSASVSTLTTGTIFAAPSLPLPVGEPWTWTNNFTQFVYNETTTGDGLHCNPVGS